MEAHVASDAPTTEPCDLCGSPKYLPLFEKNGYGLFMCESCRLVITHPRPTADDLQQPYTTGQVGAGSPKGDEEEYQRYADRYRPFLELVRQHSRPGRILDVGCWNGQFLNQLGQEWESYAVELSESASAFAREHYGLNVVTGTIHDLPYPRGYFDVVTPWDIIEHVPRPRTDFQKAVDLVRPQGLVFVSTPDFECFESKFMGRKWPVITPPGHLTYFTKSTIVRLFDLAGLELVSWQRTDMPGYLPKFEIPRIGSPIQNRFVYFATKHLRLRLGSTMKIVGRKPSGGQ